MANVVRGLAEAKAAFQALPEAMRNRCNAATDLTGREVVRLAKARILASPSVRTRALLNNIAFKLNEQTGRGKAGVTSGSTSGFFAAGTGVAGELRRRRIKGVIAKVGNRQALLKPSRYAHFVEFGTRHNAAEPFMIPAAEQQKQPYLARIQAAGRLVEQDLAHVGSRNL